MQFKFNSDLKVGDVIISLKSLKADEVAVTDFVGNEQKCAQCMRSILKGEPVLVVQDTELDFGQIVLDGELQMVHIGGAYGSGCAEDYLSRMINKHTPTEDNTGITPPIIDTTAKTEG